MIRKSNAALSSSRQSTPMHVDGADDLLGTSGAGTRRCRIVATEAPPETKSFTSAKLDWINALSVDPRIRPAAFKVGVCIIQHVNADSMVAFLSDEVIRDKTNISLPEVKRHRAALREAGWLTWTRTKTANSYTPKFELIENANDLTMHRKEARIERKRERVRVLKRVQDRSPAIPEKREDRSPAILPDRSPAILRDRSPASYIHLSGYTLENTPSKEIGSSEVVLVDIEGEMDKAKTHLIHLLGDGEADNGLSVAAAIGTHRFDHLLRELVRGRLDDSAITRAIETAKKLGSSKPPVVQLDQGIGVVSEISSLTGGVPLAVASVLFGHFPRQSNSNKPLGALENGIDPFRGVFKAKAVVLGHPQEFGAVPICSATPAVSDDPAIPVAHGRDAA